MEGEEILAHHRWSSLSLQGSLQLQFIKQLLNSPPRLHRSPSLSKSLSLKKLCLQDKDLATGNLQLPFINYPPATFPSRDSQGCSTISGQLFSVQDLLFLVFRCREEQTHKMHPALPALCQSPASPVPLSLVLVVTAAEWHHGEMQLRAKGGQREGKLLLNKGTWETEQTCHGFGHKKGKKVLL